jgi:basic membrane protein A
MKKSGLLAVFLSSAAILALGACTGTGSSSSGAGSSAAGSNSSSGLEFSELTETNIGTSTTATTSALSVYTSSSPLKIALVTDSGTLNDHSFNESAWDGVNTFAVSNGGGTLNSSTLTVSTGTIQTKYYQPAADNYDTAGRVAAIRSAVSWGAKVVVLPGYLFESAIKVCINDSAFANTYFLALDCNKEDPDNNYAAYDYTNHVTSVIYREEQSGFLAGYAAVQDGHRKLGFCGGMAVPAVIRYGSGYCQGADAAANELGLANGAIGIQYYYAGAFQATAEATAYCNSWYSNGTADIIFGCGGAVYNSVTTASQNNGGKPWIGVDVNQHADTTLGNSQSTCIMKNLKSTTQIMLASWVNESGNWASDYAAKVVTVGVKSHNCCLPTPETTGDSGCWGFTTFTETAYDAVYAKLVAGTIKVNSNSDNDALAAHNFGCSAKVAVNYIK